MNNSHNELTSHVISDHDSLLNATSHIISIGHFRNTVVRPSLSALSAELDKLNNSDGLSDEFLVGDFEELQKRTIEGYLIAVQSMWERGIRGMLITLELRMSDGTLLDAIKAVSWVKLKAHFLRLLGIPIESFYSYGDLELLQNLGNAIRHGDGNSALQLYQLYPYFWPCEKWSNPKNSLNHNAPEHTQLSDTAPSFDQISIPAYVLEQMIQSVMWFWEDIDNIRCNSFKRKHITVVHRLNEWESNINLRNNQRAWKS